VTIMEIDEVRLQKARRVFSLHGKLHASEKLTRMLISFGTSADQTTLLSAESGLIGIYCMYLGLNLLAVVFLWVYIAFDYSDGWIARYNGTASKHGEFLDHINHGIVVSLMLLLSAYITNQYAIGIVTMVLFLTAISIPYQETGLLGTNYSLIRRIGVQLLPEFGIFFGLIFNRLDILLLCHFLLYTVTILISILSRVRGTK